MNDKKDDINSTNNLLDKLFPSDTQSLNKQVTEEQIEAIKNFHLFKSKHLSREFIIKNFKRLWWFYSDKIKCESGSDNVCTNPQGVHYDFDVGANGELFMQAYRCPKVQQKLDSVKFKDNYLVCHFNKKLYSKLRLNNIYVNFNHHPSRHALIAHLQAVIEGKIDYGFYLHGEPSIGKTYILIAACNDLAIKGKTIAFTYIPQIIQELRSSSKTNGYTNRDILIENLKEADVLVFDDLGAESTNAASWFYSDFLAPILNYRMEYSKLTFFVSNYSLAELSSKLMQKYYRGQQIMDKMGVLRIARRISSLTNNTNYLLEGTALK